MCPGGNCSYESGVIGRVGEMFLAISMHASTESERVWGVILGLE